MIHNPTSWLRDLAAVGLALTLVLTVGIPRLQAAGPNCLTSSGQPRACTTSEEMWGCIQNGVDAYNQCRDSGGFLNWVGCSVGWEIDFYSCVAMTPVAMLLAG